MFEEKVSDLLDGDELFNDAFDTLVSNKSYVYDSDYETILYDEKGLANPKWLYELGATKICIILKDIVLKKGFSGVFEDYDEDNGVNLDSPKFTDWDVDYADIEYQLFNKAKEEGLINFFAKVVDVGGNVYAQEKCDYTLEEYLSTPEDFDFHDRYSANNLAVEKFCKKNNLIDLVDRCRTNVCSFLIVNFSLEELMMLQDFLNKYDINDVHASNIGFFGNELKIFDYSGFHSDTGEILKKDCKGEING